MAGGALQRLPKGNLKQIIAIGSGKGGVGKSTVTALVASEMARRGRLVGILDADVTGASIPKLFGLSGPLKDRGEGIEPMLTPGGIRVVSSQFLLEDEDRPVIWRGPLVTRLITQFFGSVNWGPLDYLFLDMPPGTSDVPLTVFQTIPTDGMVFVSTPQELSALIVKKAINMAEELHVPLAGLIENMATVTCPHCGESFEPYGKSHAESMTKAHNIPFLGRLPVEPKLSELADGGRIWEYHGDAIVSIVDGIEQGISDAQKRNLKVL